MSEHTNRLDIEGMKNKFPDSGLQNLIRNKQLGRKMPELSSDCGGVPTVKNLSRLMNAEHKELPSPDVIRGLARGLRVRLVDVLTAAAISTGLPVQAEESTSLTIPGAAKLPEESRRLILEMSENMLWWQEQVDTEGETTGVVPDEVPDNVHQLHSSDESTEDWSRHVADHGQPGIEHDQLPED